MQYFSTPVEYLSTKQSIKDKIIAIDAIIAALLQAMAQAAIGENVVQYSLNDGQTIISATNRSTKSIADSITGMEVLRAQYVKKIQGGVTRMVDGKNFTGRNGC